MMAAKRTIIFSNDSWYHIFNRGIEGRPLFLIHRDYSRFLAISQYYQYCDVPMRYSYFTQLNRVVQENTLNKLMQNPKRVTISSYCLMPNHFHMLIRQNITGGISRYVSDISNSYSKYFNTKNKRIGTLFQGIFKAVYIEGDEQMLHVSRYIHINPYVSSLCQFSSVFQYPWSSLESYVNNKSDLLIEKEYILRNFSSKERYREFVEDQISLVKKTREMRYLLLE